jgi:hypothetical protein
LNPDPKGLWFKMSFLLDLCNIWFAHEVHLQVAIESREFLNFFSFPGPQTQLNPDPKDYG